MQIDTGLLFSLLSILLAAVVRPIKNVPAARNNGAADGEMKADVKYIKNSIEKQEKKLDKQRTLAVSGG